MTHDDPRVSKFVQDMMAKRREPMPLDEAARTAATAIEYADPVALSVAVNPQAIATLLRELGFNANIGGRLPLAGKRALHRNPSAVFPLEQRDEPGTMEKIVERIEPIPGQIPPNEGVSDDIRDAIDANWQAMKNLAPLHIRKEDTTQT
jgi:hypothetical protein